MKRLVQFISFLFLFLFIVAAESRAAVNLVISGGIVPNSMYNGASYPITIYVQNTGSTSTTTSFIVNISINSSNTYNGTQSYLTQFTVNGLAAGAIKTLTTTITIPCTYATGTKYILAGADATNTVFEGCVGCESDNNYPFGVLIKSLPDLTPLAYSLSSSTVTAGSTVTANFAINNDGSLPAGNFNIGFYLSSSSTLNVNQAIYLAAYTSPSVPACGQTTSLSKVLTIPAGTCSGNYFLFMWIDNGNAITEVDDQNNFQNKPVTITGGNIPPTPVVTSATAITQTSFQSNWNTVTGASGYRLDVSTNNSFSSFVPGYDNLDVGNAISKSVTGLACGTNYYYRIRSYNSCGITSAYSSSQLATTANCISCNAPPTPTGLIQSSSTTNSISLSWTASLNASSYIIKDCNSGSTYNVTTGTSYTVTGLAAGTNYSYQVIAVGSGCNSAASSCVPCSTLTSTCTPPAIPTGLKQSSSTTNSISLSWTASANASSYIIKDCSSGITYNATTGTSYTITGLAAGTNYFYQIIAVGSACNSAASSCVPCSTLTSTCTPPAIPTGLKQSSSTTNSISLSWTASANASSYIIKDCSSGTTYNATTGTSYTVTGLAAGTNYSYQIIAVGAACNSAASSCIPCSTLTSSCTPPAIPTGLKQSSSTTNSISLSWTASANASSYIIKDCNSGTTYNATGTSYIITGLAAGTNYSYQIIAVGAACNSAASTCVPCSTLTSSCTPPAIPTGLKQSSSTTNSVSLSWTASANASSYIIKDCNSGTTYNATTGTSFTVTGLAAGTNYSYQISAVGSACNSIGSSCVPCSTLNIITTPPSITINQQASIIPLWQRENDNLIGSIVANYSNIAIGETIQLDVYVDGKYSAPTTIYWIVTNTTGSHQFDFNIDPNKLIPTPKNGNILGYQLINPTTKAHDEVSIQTKIINKQWKNENYIFYNIPAETISIPLKYINNTTGTVIQFTRTGKTSDADNTDNIFTALTGTYIQNGNQPYIKISYNNSNIEKVKPGEFDYTVKYVGTSEVEKGILSLTKVGAIKNTNNNKVLIMINGYTNQAEENAKEIKSTNSTWENSQIHFSIVPYLCQSGIDAWYVGQPNTNSIKRNAYDVAKAIEKIISITSGSEYFLICHSKGGLDTRALLGSTEANHTKLNESLSGDYFVFKGSPLDGKIKKVVFLATPHKGAFFAYIGSLANVSPATIDLEPTSPIIKELESTDMPTSISFANLTGFILLTTDDGVVPIRSSEYPYLGNNRKAVQMYQNDYNLDNRLFKPFHEKIHETYNLSNNSEWTCNSTLTNKEKIKRFLLNDYSEACQRDPTKSYSFQVSGSVVSGSKISIYENDSSKNYIGDTDENGFINILNISNNYLNSKVEIEAAGYDTMVVALDSNFRNSDKLRVPLIKNNSNTTFVQYASLSLGNQGTITSDSVIQLKITGKNVSRYLINQKTSDSIFIPLNLIGNIANISLDTGYNLIIIKFCGIDTSIQKKEIYYLPDSLMNLYATDVRINTTPDFINSKMYVNNKFYKTITSLSNTIKLLKAVNEVKFIKSGYKDSLFIIDSIGTIQFALTKHSYTSTDSSIVNFSNGLNPQYWKTITIKNISSGSPNISLKQLDDPFPNTNLMPETRKFIFRNLGNSNAKLKTAIALDQIETPDSSNVYLLTNKNGQYIKYRCNQAGVTEYDPEVQKLEFDSLSIDANQSQEIVLMKKQAPVLKSVQLTPMKSGETKTIPLNALITDPDSIKNDISATIQSTVNPAISSTIQNGNIIVTCKRGYTGIISVTLTAEHDFITVTKRYNIIVNPPDITLNEPFIYPNPATNNINIEYILDKDKEATVNIYNKLGQVVKTIPNVYYGVGYRSIPVDISNLAAGVYIVKLNNQKKVVQFVKH